MNGNGIFGNGNRGSIVDVAAILDSDLPREIAGIVERGCLVGIGTTRDGGALSLTVTYDGEWTREYFRDATDALDWLTEVATKLEGAGVTARKAPETVTPKAVRRPSKPRNAVLK